MNLLLVSRNHWVDSGEIDVFKQTLFTYLRKFNEKQSDIIKIRRLVNLCDDKKCQIYQRLTAELPDYNNAYTYDRMSQSDTGVFVFK